MLGVMTAGLDMMMLGVAGVPMRAVRMMSRLFVLGGMLVVFGSLMMVLDACVIAHIRSPGLAIEVHILYANRLTLC